MARDERKGHECVKCKGWASHKLSADGLCPICNEKKKKQKPIIECALAGCKNKFTKGSNRKYCIDHRGLSTEQKKLASRKLLRDDMEKESDT